MTCTPWQNPMVMLPTRLDTTMKTGLCFALAFIGWMTIQASTGKPPSTDDSLKTAEASDQRVELGRVHWNRDLNNAQQQSTKSGKPIFTLFQEVPG